LAIIQCERSNAKLVGLLDSPKLISLIKSLQETFDVVLIDTPALTSGPEGFIVSSRADGALFVAVHLKTPKPSAKEGRERLETSGAKLVGTVLNKAIV
jgi:Mrp family chromosome partitioning ATPase